MPLADRTDDRFNHVARTRRRNLPAAPLMRYFFHLVGERQRIVDRLGVELRGETVMSSAVLGVIREMWPGTADRDAWAGWSVEIVDAHGRVVRILAL